MTRKDDSSHHVYLLDTMNNVLGILILVLILTQVLGAANSGVALVLPGELDGLRDNQAKLDAQIKLQSTLITEHEIIVTERGNSETAASISTRNAELQALQDAEIKNQTELAKLSNSLKAAAQQAEKVPSQADLEEMLARANKPLQEAKDQLQASLEQLKSLQETASRGGQALDIGQGRAPQITVTLDRVYFICRKGKVAYEDIAAMNQAFSGAAQGYKADLQVRSERGSLQGLTDYINAGNYGDASFRLRLELIANNVGVWIVFDPRYTDKWADSKNLQDEDARLKKKLAEFDPHKTAIEFDVWNDSFENYVHLVTIAKNLGFKTRWVPFTADEEDRTAIGPGVSNGQSNGFQVDQ